MLFELQIKKQQQQQQQFETVKFSSIPNKYIRFHGMFCDVPTAKDCTESFDGVILFGPQLFYNEPSTDLRSIDFSSNTQGPLTRLSIVSYYLLVILSFTGFSSAMGWTKLLKIETDSKKLVFSKTKNDNYDKALRKVNNQNTVNAESFPELHLPPRVLDYVCTSVEADQLYEVRRFEFQFFGSLLSVIMFHFECSKGKLHLVETYQINNKLLDQLGAILSRIIIWLQKKMQPASSMKKSQ